MHLTGLSFPFWLHRLLLKTTWLILPLILLCGCATGSVPPEPVSSERAAASPDFAGLTTTGSEPAANDLPETGNPDELEKAPGDRRENTSDDVPEVVSTSDAACTEATTVRQPRGRQDIRAVYLTSWTAGHNLDAFLDLIDKTELNAVVIDIREGDGKVAYPTAVAAFRDHKGSRMDYDPRDVLARLHERDIWVIGRIVCFKDAFLPKLFPDLAIRKQNGDPLILTDPNGTKGYWLNPAEPAAWEPLAELTAEAAELGFDEIQYDYVRFPETTLFRYDLGDAEDIPRHVHIEGFLARARAAAPEAVLSVDLFGVPCLFTEDIGGLGQRLESIGSHIDAISPMVYPSHYCRYETGNLYGNIREVFDSHPLTLKGKASNKPDRAPYEVVYNSLVVARSRLDAAGFAHIPLRPYLQGFTMTAIRADSRLTYGAEAYRDQIRATEDAGGSGWIFWNASNQYATGAFLTNP